MKTALVTGASSGIGETFARELASRNTDLILVARSQDKLEQLATELTARHEIKAEIIVKDLTESASGKAVFDEVQARGLTVDLLINNAGLGDYGVLGDRPLSKQLAMVQLNITVLLELTGLFLPVMQQRNSGGIINISSIAGFQPLPYMSVYAATKAFVLNFSEALWAENRNSGVNVLAVCPGPTESQFFKRADFPDTFTGGSASSMASSEEVVQQSLEAIDKRQSTIVTGGIGNQLIANVPRFFPRDLLVSAVEKQFKR